MPSGRPDWYSSVAMHGKFAEVGETDKYITVNVDELGNMLALMTGKLNETYTPIAVDDQGIMRANLALQDLATLKTRPRYGKLYYTALTRDHPGIETWTTPISPVGTGYVFGGYLRHYGGASHKTCSVEIIVDGITYPKLTFAGLMDFALYGVDSNPIYPIKYDETAFEYIIGFPHGLTFEETFLVKVYEDVGAGGTRGGFFYSTFK